jgi:hypothetical protein
VTDRIPDPLSPGEQLLPGYEVIDLLSRGAALDVYEVYSEERDCSVVAKVIRPDRRDVPRVRRRLLQECRLLQTLARPIRTWSGGSAFCTGRRVPSYWSRR